MAYCESAAVSGMLHSYPRLYSNANYLIIQLFLLKEEDAGKRKIMCRLY